MAKVKVFKVRTGSVPITIEVGREYLITPNADKQIKLLGTPVEDIKKPAANLIYIKGTPFSGPIARLDLTVKGSNLTGITNDGLSGEVITVGNGNITVTLDSGNWHRVQPSMTTISWSYYDERPNFKGNWVIEAHLEPMTNENAVKLTVHKKKK